MRSFTALLRLDLGFDPRGVLTFNLGFSEERYDTNDKQRALVDAVAGLATGVFAAWVLRRSVESMLFEVAADDALTFGAVALLLIVVSALATCLPALNAARIDPAAALRAE